jgi:hypothetical protein
MALAASIRGKQFLPRVVLAWLAAAGATATPAQQPSKPQAGPPRTILLPPRIVAGLPATLAVLDAAGRLVPGAAVELSSGTKLKTDATGRALFAGPRGFAGLTAHISGQSVTASTVVEDPPKPAPGAPAANALSGLQILSFPHFLSLHDRFAIEGSGFRGQADANQILLAGQPSLVLASSPVALVVLPGPRVPIGTADLRLSVAGVEARAGPVTAVLLAVTGPVGTWHVGDQGMLTVRAYGTAERLVVEVRDASPEIVQLSRGSVQRVTTSGGERNAAEVEMKSLAPGDYTVTARLVPTASGLPDLEAARQKLLAARALATGSWTARLDRLIERIDREPQDTAGIRTELERMLEEKPSGQFASLLQSARQEIVKN